MLNLLRRSFSVENKLFINGQWVSSRASTWYDVKDPSTQNVVSRVPETTTEEFNQVVSTAKAAQKLWRDVPVSVRLRKMQKFLRLVNERTEDLAKLITLENGKPMADSRGDIFRGVEVIEHSLALGTIL